MNVEKTTLVWLTAGEVHAAVRDYVRSRLGITPGQDVSPSAGVTGLDSLTEAKFAVSVVLVQSKEVVT